MTNETEVYRITLQPRGPNSCEWKLWPTSGGVAKLQGVAKNALEAQKAAQKAKERLEAKSA